MVAAAAAADSSATNGYEIFSQPRGGMGVRTTRAFPAGSHIFAEPVLFQLPTVLFSNAPGMVKEIMRMSLKDLNDEERRSFLSLGNCFKNVQPAPEPQEGETPQPVWDPLSGTFLTNCIAISDNTSAVFRITSRLNHSCTPNAKTIYFGNTTKLLSLFTLVPLPVGAELTISYIDVLLPVFTRQEQLSDRYHFECRCDTCALTFGQDDNFAGRDLKLAKASEQRRRRIGLLKQVLASWAERRVRGVTVMKIADEVLNNGGTLDQEGLIVFKAGLWAEVCGVAAAHSSISHTRRAATAAYEAYLIETGSKGAQTTLYSKLQKDPRKHPSFGRREYVDFDAPAEQEVDLESLVPGWEGEDLEKAIGSLKVEDGSGKKKKKKKKKAKKSKGEATVEGEGEGEDEDEVEESPAPKTTDTTT